MVYWKNITLKADEKTKDKLNETFKKLACLKSNQRGKEFEMFDYFISLDSIDCNHRGRK